MTVLLHCTWDFVVTAYQQMLLPTPLPVQHFQGPWTVSMNVPISGSRCSVTNAVIQLSPKSIRLFCCMEYLQDAKACGLKG